MPLINKFDLSFGRFRISVEDAMLTGHTNTFECKIGSNGNQVYNDNHGNRYVPYVVKENATLADVKSQMFEACPYIVISATGLIGYLAKVEKL